MLANVCVDAYSSGSIKELSIDFDPSGHATGFVRGSSGALVMTAVIKQLPGWRDGHLGCFSLELKLCSALFSDLGPGFYSIDFTYIIEEPVDRQERRSQASTGFSSESQGENKPLELEFISNVTRSALVFRNPLPSYVAPTHAKRARNFKQLFKGFVKASCTSNGSS